MKGKQIKIKHRWSVDKSPFLGMTFDRWWRLLRQNRFQVDAVYWHRAAVITLATLGNSLLRRRENRHFRAAVEKVQVTEPPLFILGYWRSGTTHLHNLFAQDDALFTFPNTFQVINPSTFLVTEKIGTRLLKGDRPVIRGMDNMTLTFQTPQEDEFALMSLTLHSIYTGMSFPQNEEQYRKFLTFKDAAPAEVAEWKEAFLWFAKKLTLKNPRALLLKSPAHTARIPLLLEMFPKARFIHIHRNPGRVVQSSLHTFDTMSWHSFLQKPDFNVIEDRVMETYKEFHDTFFATRHLIPPGQFHEVSFDEMERDPMGMMRNAYQKLSLPGYPAFEPKLRAYVDSLRDYKKNEFTPLPAERREKIYSHLRPYFDQWNYKADW